MEIEIYKGDILPDTKISDIHRVIDECNRRDGTSYDFDSGDDYRKPGDLNYFILYGDGKPLSALYLFVPTSAEAEVYGFTVPDQRRRGYMTSLLGEVVPELRRRSIPSLLFVCDGKSEDGAAFIKRRKTAYDFSEFSMILETPVGAENNRDIDIRPVTEEDRQELIRINGEAFNEERRTVEETVNLFYTSEKRDFYAVIHDGKVVGMIGRYLEENRDYIHGFAMDASVRGRGWGQQALWQLIDVCRRSDPSKTVVLEVESENERALNLYKRCGFRLVSRFDYYRESI
ncbi:MAG: GNAT family N-acetyltransferase [Spirochaetales bacterium]|nr:GNAT family N-acetyltransferase [Spirochaetales bacterium]